MHDRRTCSGSDPPNVGGEPTLGQPFRTDSKALPKHSAKKLKREKAAYKKLRKLAKDSWAVVTLTCQLRKQEAMF
jgi:hypothetical protein